MRWGNQVSQPFVSKLRSGASDNRYQMRFATSRHARIDSGPSISVRVLPMSLPLELVAEPTPFQQDEDGVLRVGGTRVTLDSVISAFKKGSAAEEILLKYPSLNLTDIYATITYYLWRRDSVEEYLESRHQAIVETRQDVESRFSPIGLRERLLARRGPQS
jgi:uncharacterized protein (DUF433 family)